MTMTMTMTIDEKDQPVMFSTRGVISHEGHEHEFSYEVDKRNDETSLELYHTDGCASQSDIEEGVEVLIQLELGQQYDFAAISADGGLRSSKEVYKSGEDRYSILHLIDGTETIVNGHDLIEIVEGRRDAWQDS